MSYFRSNLTEAQKVEVEERLKRLRLPLRSADDKIYWDTVRQFWDKDETSERTLNIAKR